MKNFLLLFLLLTFPMVTFAHPGRTDSSGCHTCRTNCSSWGLGDGEYHCHNSGSSSESTFMQTETVEELTITISSTENTVAPLLNSTLYPTYTPYPTYTQVPTEAIPTSTLTEFSEESAEQEASKEPENEASFFGNLMTWSLIGGGAYWWYKRKKT